MYFVPPFGHAKVYEIPIWTPCFQILAKAMLLVHIDFLNVFFSLSHRICMRSVNILIYIFFIKDSNIILLTHFV